MILVWEYISRLSHFLLSCRFTYTEDPNYGPFLQSVNGLAGSNEERTYWELLVNTTNNEIIRPDVGESTKRTPLYPPFIIQQVVLTKQSDWKKDI